MPGPCSMPNGSKTEWLNLNEIVCNLHKDCTPANRVVGKGDKEVVHDFSTRRIWLSRRNRLRTGKTA